MSASTFRNRIPKRKYQERAQPQNREKLGLLEKKKDYKQRAINYHNKQDRLRQFQVKASLRNEDEFYFKMLKANKNEQDKHVEQSEDDSDFNQRQFRASVKTENYNVVKLQRAIAKNKVEKLRGQLHMISQPKNNSHKLFIDQDQDLQNFNIAQKFNTIPELVANKMLDVCPESLKDEQFKIGQSSTLKLKYEKLANYMQKDEKLTKIMSKIAYDKNLLTKQRKIIKKHGKVKYHKFFMERKR